MRAVLAVNSELVRLYWDIGRLIDLRQEKEGWGTAVIPRLAHELRNELAEERGFSERNVNRMLAFFRAYPDPAVILPQAVAKLGATAKLPQPAAKLPKLEDSLLWIIPWGHHALLMEKVEAEHRDWYMRQILSNGWSRNVLLAMIQSDAHRRQGAALTNFDRLLPAPQSDLVRQTLKDPYIFDFLTLQEPFHEQELEVNLLRQLERFLLELGQGFAFVGRQVDLEIGNTEYFVDLLFYHLKLRCFIVIDLKKGTFKPEYAGKMNFYLSVVDDKLRHSGDAPSIGLILCQDRNQIVVEYALRGMNKPIGVSEYQFTRALPKKFQSVLPTVEEIEAEFGERSTKKTAARKLKTTSSKKLKGKRLVKQRRK